MRDDISEQFRELLADHQHFHSEFQLDRFVIGAAGHPWHQYQQALRELETRWESMKSEQLDIEEAKLDIAEADDDPRGKLEKARATLRLEGMERRQKDRLREFAHLLGKARVLREWAGTQSDHARSLKEAAAWKHRIKTRVALEVLTHGQVSIESAESAFLLDEKDRKEVVSFISDCREDPEWAVSWLEVASGPDVIPKALTPDIEEVKALLCR